LLRTGCSFHALKDCCLHYKIQVGGLTSRGRFSLDSTQIYMRGSDDSRRISLIFLLILSSCPASIIHLRISVFPAILYLLCVRRGYVGEHDFIDYEVERKYIVVRVYMTRRCALNTRTGSFYPTLLWSSCLLVSTRVSNRSSPIYHWLPVPIRVSSYSNTPTA
jgi:hypothetical protein